jgi:intergrase/recombinase
VSRSIIETKIETKIKKLLKLKYYNGVLNYVPTYFIIHLNMKIKEVTEIINAVFTISPV